MGKRKRPAPSQIYKKKGLEEDIDDEKFVKPKNRFKVRLRCDEDEEFVDSGLTRKIIETAREQLIEEGSDSDSQVAGPSTNTVRFSNNTADSDDDDVPPSNFELEDGNVYFEDIKLNEENELAIEQFMNKNPSARRNLGDYILEKFTEKQTLIDEECTEPDLAQYQEVPPQIADACKQIGEVLKKYRSRNLPKMFKFMPRFANWEQLLELTDPPSWSSAAMYEATRIFASNLDEKSVVNFYKYVLLPRVRDEIASFKRLNYHLYQSVWKALFKQFGFMKGFLIPLCESGTCTLREAIIIGSLLSRKTFQAKPLWYALKNLSEIPYSGANSIFLRILIDKKYTLPRQIIDSLSNHFLSFANESYDNCPLPVLWHQSFLSFVQHEKCNIVADHRKELAALTRKRHHIQISPEIIRELNSVTEDAMATD